MTMEALVQHMLLASRGGATRLRIVRALRSGPSNPNELKLELGLDYKTVQYHLDLLLGARLVRLVDPGPPKQFELLPEVEAILTKWPEAPPAPRAASLEVGTYRRRRRDAAWTR